MTIKERKEIVDYKKQLETDLRHRVRFMEELIRDVLTVEMADKGIQASVNYYKKGAEQVLNHLKDELVAIIKDEVPIDTSRN